jgi:toxin ParE1/3/4
MTFSLRPAAETDIESITSYIAQDKPAAARHWFDSIHRACERLGDMPQIGVARDDVRPGLRLFAVGNYLILYQVAKTGVEIVRVLHGARQWQVLLLPDCPEGEVPLTSPARRGS